MKDKIIIGTRASNLALIQANLVKKILEEFDSNLEISLKLFKTKGDRILDSALSKIGDKGLFTRELELALYEGSIHLAVHSLKDLPTQLPEGIVLGAVLEREDVRDAFMSRDGRTLKEFTDGDVIGTSSLRRSSQLLKLNENFNIIDIRGNIETRLKKMEEGYCDATILACAGLNRAGLSHKISESIDPNLMIPAVSQGIIGIEVLEKNVLVKNILKKINHEHTWIMAEAERLFLGRLEGGCQVPVACHSKIDGDQFYFTGFVCDLQGKREIKVSLNGLLNKANDLAEEVAETIIEAGGDLILKEIKDLGGHG